jgi:hypothetical protein
MARHRFVLAPRPHSRVKHPAAEVSAIAEVSPREFEGDTFSDATARNNNCTTCFALLRPSLLAIIFSSLSRDFGNLRLHVMVFSSPAALSGLDTDLEIFILCFRPCLNPAALRRTSLDFHGT